MRASLVIRIALASWLAAGIILYSACPTLAQTLESVLSVGARARSQFGMPTMSWRSRINDFVSSWPVTSSTDGTQAHTWRFKRRYLHDLAAAGNTFVSDLAYVYSSPARLNKRSALWLGGIVGLGAVIYIYDREILEAFERSRDASLYKPIRQLGDEFESIGHMGNTNRYYLAAILAGYVIGYKPLVTIPAEILEAQLIAGVAKDAGNVIVGRSRPFEGRGPRHFEFNDGTSFPSGHAKNVIIAARVISRRIDFFPVTLAAYTVAGAVSLQRITSESHWPSDVYFAAVYGWITANELLLRHDRGRQMMLSAMSPGTNNTVGFRISYCF